MMVGLVTWDWVFWVSKPWQRAANEVRLWYTSSFLLFASVDLCYDPFPKQDLEATLGVSSVGLLQMWNL
jgi:hypothetical protein